MKKSDEQNAKMLPDLCYSILPTSGDLIIIKLNEAGYYPCDYSTPDAEANRRVADELNRRMGISKAQEAAMVHGSLFGWHVPAADPSHYDDNGEPIIQPKSQNTEYLESQAEERKSMNRESFIKAVHNLLPGCTGEAISIWIDFAGECVDMRQYVDFVPETDRTAAIEKWLGSIYAGFYSVKKEFDESVANQICNLSLIRSCLYPGEMKPAAGYLQSGVDVKEVIGLINSGALEEDSLSSPRLEDVELEDEYDDEI
jgi:hypothetical protein